jgi:RHS repeat-associated protein
MYADGESGLIYNGARYYDPRLGRYLQFDPIGMIPALNPTPTWIGGSLVTWRDVPTRAMNRLLVAYGLNQPYAYVENNPLRHTDPTGLFWPIDCVNCLIQSSKFDEAVRECKEEFNRCGDPERELRFYDIQS